MRHGDKVNNLGRTASHRRAMLANMTNSLIEHKRISTTLAKARALRRYADMLRLSYDGILAWNSQDGIEFWNEGAAALYGYSAEQAAGKVAEVAFEYRIAIGGALGQTFRIDDDDTVGRAELDVTGMQMLGLRNTGGQEQRRR